MAIEPGRMLSHYRLIEKIGEGGMGVVHRAHDTRLQRDVALKVLPAGLLSDETLRGRFRREARALSKLNHPNIATVHDFDTQEGVDFLVMELIRGVTLKEKLSRGALSEKEVVHLGTQLAEGLAAAHDEGVIHRDLKPGNLQVTPDERLKILDFGLAKLLQPADPSATATAMTETQGLVGTPMYMSPEQLRGEPVSASTDIFATGVVLYEMATGRHPFEAALATAVIADIQHKLPTSPRDVNPSISSGLEEVILKCLEKNPEHRYQSTKELLVDLRPLAAQVLPVSPRPVQSVARRVGLGLAAAAVVSMVLVALNVSGLRDRLLRGIGPAPVAVADQPSLAVLPFQNLSADPENEYFSDGMTAELTSKLSRIQNLQVAARTSVARFKGTQKDIKEIGKELGVRYLTEGSVRRAGNRVRISARLIDTSTGFHLWSDDFDGELKDVFAVQEETALKIAEALNLHLSPQEAEAVRRRSTQNPEAYDAYLRGWALVESFGGRFERPEKLEAAREHFERALVFDPNYPLALTGLSQVEGYYYFFLDVDRTSDRLQRAEEFARRALVLDPQLPEAHVAMGDIHAARDDFVRAVDEFRQALRLDNRNAYAWEELAWALNKLQPPDPKEAEKAAREAIRLQPGYFWSYFQLGRALRLQANYEEAIATLENALQLNPDSHDAYCELGEVYLDQGKYNQALAHFNEARRMGETPDLLVQISATYAVLGDKEKALSELEKALAAGYRDFAAIDARRDFASLRSDPCFVNLLRRMNSPE